MVLTIIQTFQKFIYQPDFAFEITVSSSFFTIKINYYATAIS